MSIWWIVCGSVEAKSVANDSVELKIIDRNVATENAGLKQVFEHATQREHANSRTCHVLQVCQGITQIGSTH